MAEKKTKKIKDDGKLNIGMIAGIIIATVCVVCVIIAVSLNSIFSGKQPDVKVAPIVGTWKYSGYSDYSYVFNADGTCSYVNPCTYKDNGDSVEILFDGNTDSQTLKYRIEGTTLYIEYSFGDEVKYEKQ